MIASSIVYVRDAWTPEEGFFSERRSLFIRLGLLIFNCCIVNNCTSVTPVAEKIKAYTSFAFFLYLFDFELGLSSLRNR